MQRRCVEADMLIARSALATVDLAVSTVLMTLPQSNLCRTSDTLSDPTPHLKEQVCDIDALRFHRPDNPCMAPGWRMMSRRRSSNCIRETSTLTLPAVRVFSYHGRAMQPRQSSSSSPCGRGTGRSCTTFCCCLTTTTATPPTTTRTTTTTTARLVLA